jgi:hypothetical protein
MAAVVLVLVLVVVGCWYINTGAGEGKTNSPPRVVRSGADSYVKRLFVEQSYILHG